MNVVKRKWSKPELLVLVRGRPEEAVLATCKLMDGSPSIGANNDNFACWHTMSGSCSDSCWANGTS